jgi:hypothetical protein
LRTIRAGVDTPAMPSAAMRALNCLILRRLVRLGLVCLIGNDPVRLALDPLI